MEKKKTIAEKCAHILAHSSLNCTINKKALGHTTIIQKNVFRFQIPAKKEKSSDTVEALKIDLTFENKDITLKS